MSILSVDTISPIGSGTTVTLNATETKVNNFITVGTGATISSPSSNVLTLGTNNTERLRIKSDGVLLLPTTGKLSVGVTNPSGKFSVGPANGSRVIEIEEYGVIRGYNRNGNAWAQIDFEASSYSFDCGGAEKLKIASTGKVSIGDAATHTFSAHSEGDDLVVGGAGWRGMTIYGEGGGGVIQFADNGSNRIGQILYVHSDNSMRFRTAGNQDRLEIGSGGDVTITDGNLVVASGHGIDFSSYDPTSYGSISSEILDDYEEGSWTPTEVSGLSLTVYVANYIKIGRLVHVECGILIPTNSDGGGLQFDGLPYQAVNSGDNSGGLHLTSTNSNRNDTFYAIRNQTRIGVANLLNQNVARSAYSNKQLKFSGTYISTF